MEIEDFLPAYPNVNKSSVPLLNPYNQNFYQAIYRKKEFYDERLEPLEDFPSKKGQMMKHQKIIQRFLSAKTPYDALLLVHTMGTGKSCSSIGTIENILNTSDKFTGAVILASGQGLLDNYLNEVVFKCTAGQYIPENFDLLTSGEKIRRINKAVRKNYQFHTFQTFTKNVRRLPDAEIKQRFSNKIIVIDEVHNMRMHSNPKPDDLQTYEQIRRFLHLPTNLKILLMSGTPMKDGVEEIASVMNLILPYDLQLPAGEDFIEEYLTEQKDQTYDIKPSKVIELKERFKGHVSFLRAMQSNVRKVFIGTRLNYFTIDIDNMQSFQTKSYAEAWTRDNEEKGVYSNSRQASLFVFPDGSYGSAGYDKYIIKETRKGYRGGQLTTIFKLEPKFKQLLKGSTVNETIKNISKYSSKYAKTLQQIVDADGKSCFVYCELVAGSGLILFALLLELLGFMRTYGATADQQPRYAIITNMTTTTKQTRQILTRFNKPDNMYGEYIKVILGSRVVSEGFSLKNVQQEHILTPYWNYSEIDQAIARGIRVNSHQDLIDAGKDPVVEIYQHVSLPKNQEDSIDLYMYETSEIKDISIKRMERLLKEAAVDCALNYARNSIGVNGSRECDYMDCSYSCDGISGDEIEDGFKQEELDTNTYNLYYSMSDVKLIVDRLERKFRHKFRLNLVEIIAMFRGSYSQFQLLTALRQIINSGTTLTNQYGFPSYLKEESDMYFLVDSLSADNHTGAFFSAYYTQYPNIYAGDSFADIFHKLQQTQLPRAVERLLRANASTFKKIMSGMPLEIQETYIEAALLAQQRGLVMNIDFRDRILEYFEEYITEIEDVYISSLLFQDKDNLRCLFPDGWTDCTNEFYQKYLKQKTNIQVELETNPYGYYGIYDTDTDKFCIRDVRGLKKERGRS